ncbi:nicotinate-nucleotide pyrophosphorylase [carboxylating]-like isoform X2 [Oryzias latipes]|uniref:nicotinate-nucleotide pyrophosphorylase [carboxylating]-like isoform X2 n=1 Tax=Oryzias latipes TaxID=8090 RepID=UPI000CE1BF51|nr:nicotinate-nucleotide pyrophosphorylase [carboxylating]-like isoform X2 [Oryzias latipes]
MSASMHPVAHSVPRHTLTRLAREWLAEDTPNFDPAGVCVGSEEAEARLLCKSPRTVLAGCPFFTAVFNEVGCTVDWIYQEGAELEVVTITAVVRGPARDLLLGERPALNCLARGSGIATCCSRLQSFAKAAGWHEEVAGTRKTTPGFRLVEKYAMLVGGASMHRQDLSGMVMLMDNHVWTSGSITKVGSCASSVECVVQKLCMGSSQLCLLPRLYVGLFLGILGTLVDACVITLAVKNVNLSDIYKDLSL